MKKLLLSLATCICTINVFSQTDTTKNPLTINGYVEVFYAYDFAKPQSHIKQPFLYTYNRHNSFAVNLALLKANYDNGLVRGNVALMAGTYSNDNMAAEPGALKNIYEANAGVKISKTKNIWIDAGIMPSHIGWESAVGKDCPTLTRSIAAENSPYFETGARVSYTTDNGKWYVAGLVLNGWQRIERVPGNNTPAFGHQLTYKPNDKITVNSSSFIGNDKPDSVKQMRYFHDLYGQFAVNDKFYLTLGFDIGVEQKARHSKDYSLWYSPNIIAQFKPNNKWVVAFRGEYYNDESGVMIDPGITQGFQTFGYSINVDRIILNNFMWRIEARTFNSKDKIFLKNGNAVNGNFFITSSLAIAF